MLQLHYSQIKLKSPINIDGVRVSKMEVNISKQTFLNEQMLPDYSEMNLYQPPPSILTSDSQR